MTETSVDVVEEKSQEEMVLALLESATKSLDTDDASRKAFQQRLQSFRPATYFAKPASISPLVCARFGYVTFCIV